MKIRNLILLAILTSVPAWGVVGMTHAMQAPEQGTMIECEECVVLYPEKYVDDPESCPVCDGRKEHFQPARFMDENLAEQEAKELQYRFERDVLEIVMGATEETVNIEVVKELREDYMRQLRFSMIHGFIDLEMTKAHIYKLDEFLETQDRG